uniref:Large ribosomal subunit protein uL23c n=1 Tax=Acrochaetium secundatum TaxID=209631 RepID=A0A4D6BN73_9FLOR|nr:ribosomal protein L23 [Acrochaetium secundatum]QBX88419.1 ribosomal protein L23 [Acrochaetium secundatum]
MLKIQPRKLIDLIKRPILTDKSTRMLEENQYCFSVAKSAKKSEIKQAIEYIFEVKVIKVNTLNPPLKKRTVGRFKGHKPQFKKAIIQLKPEDKIDLFPES